MCVRAGASDPAAVLDWDLLFGEEVSEEGGAGYFVEHNGPHARDTRTVACADNFRHILTQSASPLGKKAPKTLHGFIF